MSLPATGALGSDTTETVPRRPLRAAAMMIVASALIALTTLLAKTLGTGPQALPAFQITFGRFAFALLALVVVTLLSRPRLTRPAIPIHLVRVLAGFTGVTCMFAAATMMPLADATAISYLNPMIAMVLAIPILGERIGPVRWAAAGFALAGGLLLIRPGMASFQPASLIALAAAFVFALEVTMIKILSARESPLQILLMSNGIGTALSLVALVFVWTTPNPTQWLLLAAVGLVMVTAQACFIQALTFAEASFAVPFSYSALVFAALYDLALYSVVPDGASLTGGAIIVACAIVLAWREGLHRAKANSDDLEQNSAAILRK